jgi:PAS domain S-box-containing protein
MGAGRMSEDAAELSTARKQLQGVQQELAAERTRYRDLFELAPIAYLMTRADGVVVSANDEAAALLRVSPRSLVGKSLESFVSDQERPSFRKLLHEAGEPAGTHERELRLASRGGDEIVVRARVAARHDRPGELRWSLENVTAQWEGDIELRLLAHDLEHRVEARTEELAAERARLAAIVEQLPAGVLLVDAVTSEVVFANAAAEAILGSAAPLGSREGYRAGGEPYQPGEWPIMRSLLTGEQVTNERAELVQPDGGRVVIEFSSAPIRDRAGQVIAAVSVFHDATARERREAAEREFVTNAAHELRTPLAAIAGAIELLQSGAKDDPDARDTFLGHIERETDRLQRLVRAMLTLARVQMQTEAPRLEIVELCPLLEEAARTIKPSSRVAVEVDCPGDLAALANPDLLERVVANLAANAVRHTSAGRILLRALRVGDDAVEISVADTGAGVAAEERDRMFSRFFRGRDRSGEGFGLGLAIVSEAVRAQGGTIDVESPEGGGTAIRVRLRGATVMVS